MWSLSLCSALILSLCSALILSLSALHWYYLSTKISLKVFLFTKPKIIEVQQTLYWYSPWGQQGRLCGVQRFKELIWGEILQMLEFFFLSSLEACLGYTIFSEYFFVFQIEFYLHDVHMLPLWDFHSFNIILWVCPRFSNFVRLTCWLSRTSVAQLVIPYLNVFLLGQVVSESLTYWWLRRKHAHNNIVWQGSSWPTSRAWRAYALPSRSFLLCLLLGNPYSRNF